ncbi:hypothetical protein NQD34_002561 [Periophthalmus magnuspinnatus]|nr:hypothetical protein NQD34_002561 [Periophthalmus magnuspinnatus]
MGKLFLIGQSLLSSIITYLQECTCIRCIPAILHLPTSLPIIPSFLLSSQPPFSKSNTLSTPDTISSPGLIATSRFFMRTMILLRGGKTMGANAVSIDLAVSLSSPDSPPCLLFPFKRPDMCEDLVSGVAGSLHLQGKLQVMTKGE